MVRVNGGPNPCLAPNTCSPARATALGPQPAARATLRQKRIATPNPPDRFAPAPRVAEKPTAVTIPDRAKYSGTLESTALKPGEFINKETGSINNPEHRHTRSLACQPPRAPPRTPEKPPMSTPPPKPAVNRSPNSTPTCAGSLPKSRMRSVGAQA